ncbi:MAG: hypothetical protein HY986_04525 [Candidatus Melainabacteria bacterium]|nr:hypothetical protein [Candidatus Melainabacteria bacterium]
MKIKKRLDADRCALRERNKKGSLAAVGMLSIVGLSVAFGAFGLDVSHAVTVKEQLQVATDAGALAGARDFVKVDPPYVPSSFDADIAKRDALAVTAANYADGKPVSLSDADTKVTVSTNAAASPYTVTVTATRKVNNIFARLFGNDGQEITTTSTAAAWRDIKTLHPNQALNLAVSLDWAPSKGPQQGRSLESYGTNPNGQTFTIDLNSQQGKNSAWIKDWGAFNSPSMNFGTTPVQLDNGVRANDVQELASGDTIILPVVKGAPPYNYKTPVIGTIGFKVKKARFPQQIEGTLVTPIVFGVPGTPVLGELSPQGEEFMNASKAWQVMLIN